MQEEIFKDIPGFEGSYQVSNLGNVKSLARKIWCGKTFYISKEKILKPSLDFRGYYIVCLHINNKQLNKKIHHLVALSFLNHFTDGTTKLVVDHINNIKTDNRLENLQIITNRENCSKDTKGSSKYIGVCWVKKYEKWRAMIYVNGKNKHLGYFTCELKASEAYQNKLNEINSNQ